MRFMMAEAFLALVVFDVLELGRNFARMHRLVRSQRASQRVPASGTVEAVINAVDHACVWYPKRVMCLQRSAVTTWLLRLYGVNACMVIGAQQFPFRAHAWTEVDGRAVNERTAVQKNYRVLERC